MSKNTNLSFLTDYITADITNGRIGINNPSPTVAFDVVGATKITGVLTLTSTISNGTNTYTLPSATGTLALTSALSGYLPLTGGTLTGALGGTSASFSDTITSTGIGSTSTAHIFNNTTGTAQYYADFKAGATLIGRILRGNGASGYEANGLNIDNFSGMQIKLNTLGGSGGAFNILGGKVAIGTTFTSSGLNINVAAGVADGLSLTDNTTVPAVFTYNTSTGENKIGGILSYVFPTFYSGGSERMRITAEGNLGFGMTPYNNGLSKAIDLVGGGGMFGFNNNFYLSGNGYFTDSWRYKVTGAIAIIEMSSAGVITFATSGSGTAGASVSGLAERMRITSGGNILMGTTTDNGERLYVSGAIRATGTITANSDLTLKKNLLKIENALDKVEQINGYTYEFKADDSKRHGGVIAQEIDKVFPEIVNTGNDGLMGVEYGNISALLIEAIKEQQKAIQELSTEINLLKNK